jgi:hypothetical protein
LARAHKARRRVRLYDFSSAPQLLRVFRVAREVINPGGGFLEPPTDGVRTLVAEEGTWSKPSILIESPGGDVSLWSTASPDGESWPSSATSVLAHANRPIRFAVSPTGFAMFLWADSGSSDTAIGYHLLAMVGR